MKTYTNPIISTANPSIRKVIETLDTLQDATHGLLSMRLPVVGLRYTDDKATHFHVQVYLIDTSPIILHIADHSRPRQLHEIAGVYVPDGKEAIISNPDTYQIQFCEDPLSKEDMAFILKRGQTASWSEVTRISEA
jgi:hypothetical protein